MEKLYYLTPFAAEFQAEVLTCEKGKKGFEVLLDKTAFYPEGGGQPYDTGTLGSVKVSEVHEKGGEVIHYTDGPLKAGQTVHGRIDWDRRFCYMQQHSGEHIVSGLIHTRFGYDNVGFHMSSDEMTIDLNGVLTWEQLMEIEREANRFVYENRRLRVTYPSCEELSHIDYRSKKELIGQVRIVEIPGADVCACCGTHVERTGEIGVIKFLSMIHYKNGVRITMSCGEKALLDYERKNDQINLLSNLLSAKPEKVVEAVERLKQESADKEIQAANLTRQLFEMKTDRYETSDQSLLIFEPELSPVLIRRFCDLLLEKNKGRVVAVCSEKENGEYNYCIGSRSIDMKLLGSPLNAALAGHGGGSSLMIQGIFRAKEDEIRTVFMEETAKAF